MLPVAASRSWEQSPDSKTDDRAQHRFRMPQYFAEERANPFAVWYDYELKGMRAGDRLYGLSIVVMSGQ
jgi:hypothetical protein